MRSGWANSITAFLRFRYQVINSSLPDRDRGDRARLRGLSASPCELAGWGALQLESATVAVLLAGWAADEAVLIGLCEQLMHKSCRRNLTFQGELKCLKRNADAC